MANQDAPFGFRQVGGLGSRPTSEGTSKYVIASSFADSIYSGDVVEFGAGTSENGTSIAAGYVGTAAETSSIRNVGIFNGCFYEDPTTSKPTWKNYWPASTAAGWALTTIRSSFRRRRGRRSVACLAPAGTG